MHKNLSEWWTAPRIADVKARCCAGKRDCWRILWLILSTGSRALWDPQDGPRRRSGAPVRSEGGKPLSSDVRHSLSSASYVNWVPSANELNNEVTHKHYKLSEINLVKTLASWRFKSPKEQIGSVWDCTTARRVTQRNFNIMFNSLFPSRLLY